MFYMQPITNLCGDLTCSPMFGPSVRDPGGSFINLFRGGSTFNEELIGSRISLISPLLTTEERQFMDQSNIMCNFTLVKGSNSSFVNANQEPIIVPSRLQRKPRKTCSSRDAQNLENLMNQIKNSSNAIDNPLRLRQLQVSIRLFAQRETYKSCKDSTMDFISYSEKQFPVKGLRRCIKSISDPGYLQDPCCSDTLALTQCCAPQTGFITMQYITTVMTSPDTCNNYKEINSLLSDGFEAATSKDDALDL